MDKDIEILQDWIAKKRELKINYDSKQAQCECQIFDAIEHLICENIQYSEYNRKLKQALIDADRELREYKKEEKWEHIIRVEDFCNKHIARMWRVMKIKYDFDHDA